MLLNIFSISFMVVLFRSCQWKDLYWSQLFKNCFKKFVSICMREAHIPHAENCNRLTTFSTRKYHNVCIQYTQRIYFMQKYFLSLSIYLSLSCYTSHLLVGNNCKLVYVDSTKVQRGLRFWFIVFCFVFFLWVFPHLIFILISLFNSLSN